MASFRARLDGRARLLGVEIALVIALGIAGGVGLAAANENAAIRAGELVLRLVRR